MKIKTTRLPLLRLRFPLFLLLVAIVPALSGCQKDWWQLIHDHSGDGGGKKVKPDMFLTWNAAGMEVVRRAGFGPNGPLPPMPESRIYAIVNIAMYDALNSIDEKNKPYALHDASSKWADPDAAVAQAGHDAIVALFPPFADYADSLLAVSLSGVHDGSNKTDGISLGKAAAAAILQNRADDGVDKAQFPYVAGNKPGDYRATPPFDGPPFNGFVAVPGWGNIRPFAMTGGAQFRAPVPYAINSAAYAKDFNEIKALGPLNNSKRTADQTQIGLFWLENIPHFMNRIARGIVADKQYDAWVTARLLTLMAIAQADANIGNLESKYFYNRWRPQTAVALGDHDGNSGTTADLNWVVLAPPTPPVPDYPSNHSGNGGAGAEVLKQFLGSDNYAMNLTSESLPNVTRHYNNFSSAADDCALSRIYGGYHFRLATSEGKAQGRQIGDYVMKHSLLPNNH